MERSEIELLRAVIDTQRLIQEQTHDVEAVMAVVASRARVLTGATGAVVELVDGDEMVYRTAVGSLEGTVGERLARGTSLSGRCVAEQQPLRCDDTEDDERVDLDACRRLGLRSMVVVPLLLPGGGCVGVLKVVSSWPAAFDHGDLEVLDALAEFIATALHHAHEFADRDRRAMSDSLTGLANRAVLLDRVAIGLARADRSGDPVTVFFLDLDGFKPVNDTLGHDAGDQVLRSVARALSAAVRPTDTVARIGGDEFVVVCESVAEHSLDELVERLRWAVATAWHGALPVTASVGVARSVRGDTADVLVARADDAMYEVKRAS